MGIHGTVDSLAFLIPISKLPVKAVPELVRLY